MTHASPWRLPLILLPCALSACQGQPFPLGNSAPPPPTISSPPEIGATRLPVTPDQLAQILNLQVFRFQYYGSPPLVWLEIEETNQDTLPDRIPIDGAVAQSIQHGPDSPRQGDILFWWKRDSPNGGGSLVIQVDGRGSYGRGLPQNALTWGWPAFSSKIQALDPGQHLEALPGQTHTLLTYEATEIGSSPENSPNPSARKLVLRLMAEFLPPVRSRDEADLQP